MKGGTATLIGDPPNIMIGSANKHLDFNAFLLNLAPVVLVITVTLLAILSLLYRKHSQATPEQIQVLMSLCEKDYILRELCTIDNKVTGSSAKTSQQLQLLSKARTY